MSEYGELVNRVRAISGDTKDPKTLRVHFESAATDVDRQVLANAPQAAQAIERLEGERDKLKRFVFCVDTIPAEQVARAFLEHEAREYNPDLDFAVARLASVIQRARQDGAAASKGIVEKAEQQLADARAEIERLKNAIEFAHSEGFEWPADPLPSEALAAPAPGKDSEGKE